MNFRDFQSVQDRRRFLQTACGVGTISLAQLLHVDRLTAASEDAPSLNPLAPKTPPAPAKARNVVFLLMSGAPSQLDLFDSKPEMKKWDGQTLPPSMTTKDGDFAFIKPSAKVWASPRIFSRHGESGMEFSDYLTHLPRCADDICMIRSMYTEQINHHTGQLKMVTGTPLVGHPSMGSWVMYGLGSESENLPGFVVLNSGSGADAGSGLWGSGFLSSSYQGVPFRSKGDAVLHLSNPPGVSNRMQRARLDAVRDLNEMQFSSVGDVEIASRIASYELAFRMQMATPELLDFSKESPKTLEMYGVNEEPTRPFATNCLLARRMIERGVRFVQLIHGSWDHHSDLIKGVQDNCDIIDRPTTALVKDLKQRGLLENTLVVWGGEFGRTPLAEDRTPGQEGTRGRDHHRQGFSMWMAGGGIRGGQTVGNTDDFGFHAIEDRIHVHDLHATMLHCLGFDHKRLTYRHQGRDFRLTDVAGNVIPKLLV